jgi:hypothetical protein
MKATAGFNSGLKYSHRRENSFLEEYTGFVIIDKQLRSVVTLRIYGTNAKNYACLWYNDTKQWGNGSGSAGGYGYHRPSAAAQEAFEKGGVVLSEDIDGRGDGAIVRAVEALTRCLFPRKKVYFHKAHS